MKNIVIQNLAAGKVNKYFINSVLALAAVFLFYLAAVTQTILFHDAFGYERLGSLLAGEGWHSYFMEGINREPLYPFFVSIAMRLGQWIGVSYTVVLMVNQVLVLLLMLWLLNRVLVRMEFGDISRGIILLYAATSPAIVYTGFIVWSEVITYPLVLMIILTAVKAWKYVYTDRLSWKQGISWGGALALAFLVLTMVKAVVEMVAIFFILPWALAGLYEHGRSHRPQAIRSLVVLISFCCVYWNGIFFYKSTNFRYNGQFAVTDRGSSALYGNISRRLASLTPQQWKAAVLSIPHETDCQRLLKDREACQYWTFTVSDQQGSQAVQELQKEGLSAQAANQKLTGMAVQKILEKPGQAFLLMMVEAAKFMFWEYNARLEYVAYPRVVERWYNNPLVYPFWRYGMALVTATALIYGFTFLIRHRQFLCSPQDALFSETAFVLFMLLFVSLFIFFYSFFYASGRYAMPLAPLYLILIGFMVKKRFSWGRK